MREVYRPYANFAATTVSIALLLLAAPCSLVIFLLPMESHTQSSSEQQPPMPLIAWCVQHLLQTLQIPPNWFIVRPDSLRSDTSVTSTYAIWRPPIGLFDYDEEMGAGDYRIQLNPNSSYFYNAVETKIPPTLLCLTISLLTM